jgi:hypothetical protein
MDEYTYILAGRVIPERALLDISEVQLQVLASEDVPKGDLFIEVIKSQISVRFLASGEVRNIFTLRNIVEDAARMLLDVTGYFAGYGYDAEIVQAVRSNTSEKYVFGIDVPALAGVCEKAGIAINDIFAVLSKPDGYSFDVRLLTFERPLDHQKIRASSVTAQSNHLRIAALLETVHRLKKTMHGSYFGKHTQLRSSRSWILKPSLIQLGTVTTYRQNRCLIKTGRAYLIVHGKSSTNLFLMKRHLRLNNVFEADAMRQRRVSWSIRAPRRSTQR